MTTKGYLRTDRRNFLKLSASGLLLATTGLPAGASGSEIDVDDALGLVKSTTAQLLGEVQAEKDVNAARAFDLVAKHIDPVVDLERSARWILGKHWRKATPDQRKRFVEEFRKMLIRTYAIAVAENPNVDIEYLPVKRTKRPHEAIVETRIPQPTSPPIAIDYRLHGDDKGWKLFDVTIEGVSLVRTYRSSFSPRVRKNGLDALIEDMAEKNRQHSGA